MTDAGTDVVPDADRPPHFGVAPPSRAMTVALALGMLFLAGVFGYIVGGGRPPAESSADVGFLRDMTAHHDQAVEMASMALDQATEPLVRSFAREVLIAQRYELGLMSAWLGQWGYGFDIDRAQAMVWMGVPTPVAEMPGMASEVQMDALRDAQGRAFDSLFLSLMTEHHRGGADMATAAVGVVHDPEVLALARGLARNQRIEINEYQAARERLGL